MRLTASTRDPPPADHASIPRSEHHFEPGAAAPSPIHEVPFVYHAFRAIRRGTFVLNQSTFGDDRPSKVTWPATAVVEPAKTPGTTPTVTKEVPMDQCSSEWRRSSGECPVRRRTEGAQQQRTFDSGIGWPQSALPKRREGHERDRRDTRGDAEDLLPS